jgi:hypothetical protein
MDEFLSSDSRLRPKTPPTVTRPPSGPPEYELDEKSFPALYHAIVTLERSAGIERYRFVILGDSFGGAGVDFKRRLVGIGIGKLNSLSFNAVLAVLAHELGHIYRQEQFSDPAIGKPIPALSPAQFEEVEADRFSVCLVGKAANFAALHGGKTSAETKLPITLRVEAVDDFSLEDCPSVTQNRENPLPLHRRSIVK